MSRFTKAKESINDGTYESFLNALAHYDTEIAAGRAYLDSLDYQHRIHNPVLVSDIQRKIPGMMQHHYNLAQEAEAIQSYIEDKATMVRVGHLKRYKENYNRELSDRLIEKYADGERDYIDLRELVGEVRLRVEMFKGFTKGLDALHWQLRSYISLRTQGIEDATF